MSGMESCYPFDGRGYIHESFENDVILDTAKAHGNPAAVCVMDSWPSKEAMMKLAKQNFRNSAEDAYTG